MDAKERICPGMDGQDFCSRQILSTYIHVSNSAVADIDKESQKHNFKPKTVNKMAQIT